MKNNFKTYLLIALASLALKSTHAQEDNKPDPENVKKTSVRLNSVSVTPVIPGFEVSDKITYPFILNTAGVSFGLNKDFKFAPYMNLSAGLANVWSPGKKTPNFTQRVTANIGAGTDFGKINVSADAGIGIMSGAGMFHQFNLTASQKVCDINDKILLSAFMGAYYEKFNKTPCAIGVAAGVTFVLTR
ncbi:hypothetical protein LJC18_03560 [Lachnospiraceae bacterium OttesenSCG-928-E19]|nr:hypothetical protein [Lachnospiraceae bacterium OttesenSCG-928-E19]